MKFSRIRVTYIVIVKMHYCQIIYAYTLCISEVIYSVIYLGNNTSESVKMKPYNSI